MNEISFRRLKTIIKTSGYSIKDFAEICNTEPNCISMICCNRRTPKTDLLAKMCSILKVYPSEIVSFDEIKVNDSYFTDNKREKLPAEFTGDVTYKPLWLFLSDYLAEYNATHDVKKTENDLFDQIEPPRRIKGYEPVVKQFQKKAITARFGEGYTSQRKNRTDYSKGLTALTRTKLRNDRPLNLSVIYEICKKLGCTIDFVMGYK